MSEQEDSYIAMHKREGIEVVKTRGAKMDRSLKSLPENFYDVYQEWAMGTISGVEATKKCNMPESTFRYYAIAYRNSTQNR